MIEGPETLRAGLGGQPGHGPARLLAVVGDLVEDIVVWSDSDLRPATDNPSRITRTRGGSAANVAALAASTGASTRFIGRVGADALGAQLIDVLAGHGVDVLAQRVGRTGTIVVLVDSAGERTMFPDRGAAAELSEVPVAWLDSVAILHVTSYSFAAEPAASATLALMTAARLRGVELSLDASSTGLLEDLGLPRYLSFVEAAVPAIFFANAAEAAMLDLDSAPFAQALRIIKNGSEPTVMLEPDGIRHAVPVTVVDDVRDATGAGDAFAAGFLGARLSGRSLIDAVHAGHSLAGSVLRSPGAALDGSHLQASTTPE
jgi:sugar/nucleoside kinase (ribokinase family)